MSLSETFATYIPHIEAEMRSLLTADAPAVAAHYGMMQYHLGWLDADLKPADAPSGKRIRPMLCLLATAAAGGDPFLATPAAAGLELLHNFSLIHDDIEDNSPMRRHRATVWKSWGVSQACNVGDGMFSLAHLAFHRLSERGLPAATALRALRVFGETCVALTEGQFLDMTFEQRLDVTTAEYFHMIAGKTGALLAAAPEIGALIALGETSRVSEAERERIIAAYRQYGAMLGRAFQLQDDLLGIWGDEATTGKSAASDLLSKKKSLPVIHALNHPAVGAELKKLYAGPAFTTGDMPEVLALLAAAEACDYTAAQVRQASQQARAALADAAPFAEPGAHRLLGELLDSLMDRVA